MIRTDRNMSARIYVTYQNNKVCAFGGNKIIKIRYTVYFLNSLRLHVSVAFDLHHGALLQSTVIQRYVHSSKIYLFINMSSKIQSSCCMLTIKIKVKKLCRDI
jgi:hypothetical protein